MNDTQWLKREIATGLQRLLALRLKGAPAAETVKLVAQTWYDALLAANIGWDEALDRDRLRRAFTALTRDMTDWPQPRHLLDRLERRPQIFQPLPEPPVDAERVRQFKERLRQALRKCDRGE